MRRAIGTVLVTSSVLVASWTSPTPAYAATTDGVVQAWYRVFLERSASDAASDSDRFYWTHRLDNGDTRESVLHDLLTTREYVSLEIGEYYERYLARKLDPHARYWVDGVVHGDFVAESAAQRIVSSDEYYRTWTSGATDPDGQFIRTLYFDLLERSADQAEVDYWRGVLADKGRLALVRGIWYAQEGVTVRLNRNYKAILARPVDSDGIVYWSPIEAASDHVVRYRLGSTDEFARTWAD